MSDCCIKEYYEVGSFAHCGTIDTGLVAGMSGIFTILFSYKGQENSFRVFAHEGNNIVLFNVFSENADTKIRILNPDGSSFEYNHYNCIHATCETYNVFLISTIPYDRIIIDCDDCECPETENLQTC